MSKLALLVAMSIAYLPQAAHACLGEDRIFGDALVRDMPAENLASFLSEISSCSVVVEKSRSSDESLVALLQDAARKSVPPELLSKVLSKYRCAYSARDTPAYRELLVYIKLESPDTICDVPYLRSLKYVVPESGAVLRSGPGTAHTRLFGMPVNALLEPLGNDGDWLKVDSSWGIGFVYSPLVAPY